MRHTILTHRKTPAVLTLSAFICALLFSLLLTPSPALAQESLKVIRGTSSNNSWKAFSDVRNSLYNHLAGQTYHDLENRYQHVKQITSASGWEERQQQLRQTLAEIVGPFPEKTPLNPQVTRTVTREEYRVDHIVFESQPGFYVTSSLFIPRDLGDEKAPAVLYVSGHTPDGYRYEAYQQVILNLVKKGFIVFAIDPVGQGERLEYLDEETGESMVGGPTSEHSYPGAQAFITGSSQARYMIWDGIRAIDYLMTREEVDADRIGITGMSGGGTQTAYIAAFDDRIHAAAPSNYITNFTRLFQSLGPQDAEQNLFHAVANGIDHADFLAVRAPRPALVLSTTNDFFSIQGARETAREVEELYKVLDKPGNFSMVEDIGGHEVTRKNREALYAFFQNHLDNPGSPDDTEIEVLSEEEIRVTAAGQVSRSFGGETVYSLNRSEAQRKINELEEARKNIGEHLPDVLRSARQLSGYREPAETRDPVFTGRFQRDGYMIEKYFMMGEGAYPIPYLLVIPDESNGKGIIYLHEEGKAAEAGKGDEIEWFARKGFTVLAPDLVGMGETGTESGAGELRKEWRASILAGRSITGIRAGDVSRLREQLHSDPKVNIDEVYGVARKELSPVLVHAAAFDPEIARVALVEPLFSYRSLVTNRFYHTGFVHAAVAGALQAYDLPDLAATLAPRKLMVANVLDGLGKPADLENMARDVSIVKAAYRQNGNREDLIFLEGAPLASPGELFGEWIE
ncbi:Cephalosporin-C deacetylase [Fodinibius roseus]|uniref:Cephalosporin-C deacetylase n=1 Tax=Fodinibius roseus TaxID=1194090 RepID=A0A1M5JKV7_9BACT|nr:alpha/beta hydrolase family protein [Fodinibius roseus]SHG41158.1 Cephalosporin-C deacetylase [Fodinibius roseus]